MSKQVNEKVTWAQMVRDVAIAAINKGQLHLLGIIAMLLIIISRLSSEDLSKLTFQILDALKAGELWSYFLILLILSMWLIHTNTADKMFSKRIEKITQEKEELQKKLKQSRA